MSPAEPVAMENHGFEPVLLATDGHAYAAARRKAASDLGSLLRHRTVADVMTERVHVATPSTPFKVLVRVIEENRISAVPVVDPQGTPLGIVSESDLLLKQRRTELELEGSPLHLWRRRQEKAKAEGVIASDLMTSPVVTVSLDTAIARAARVMQDRNVRRLVVVDARGRIAGIVSRSDLLQVFLRTDQDLRDEVVQKLIPAVLPTDREAVNVSVESNVITFSGEVDRRSDVDILGRLAGEIDGVVGVINHLSYRWDDSRTRAGVI
jgi:CBS domain-containing protein